MSKGIAPGVSRALVIVATIALAFAVFAYVRSASDPLLFFLGDVKFEVAGYFSSGNKIVIHNIGLSPLNANELTIKVNGMKVPITDPSKVISSGETGVIFFDTNQSGHVNVELTGPNGYKVSYFTKIRINETAD